MANLYITEYENMTANLPLEPALAEQTVEIATEADSAAFNSHTRVVRLYAEADCHVLFGDTPTATTSSQKLSAGGEYWRAVVPGLTKVSVIATS